MTAEQREFAVQVSTEEMLKGHHRRGMSQAQLREIERKFIERYPE